MDPAKIDDLVKRQWIIWPPLFLSPWLFTAVAVVVRMPPSPEIGLPLLVASGVSAVACIGASFVLPARLRRAPGADPAGQLFTSFIIANALCEGGGLFGAVAYMVTGLPMALVAVAACSAAMTAHRPSRERIEAWLKESARQR